MLTKLAPMVLIVMDLADRVFSICSPSIISRIGEFSAFTAAPTNNNGVPSATQRVSDSIAYFESKGFAWAYHSWHSWWGWDPDVDQSEALGLYDNGKFDGSFPVNRDTNSLTSHVLLTCLSHI